MDQNEHTEPRIYELGYHLVPTLAEEQIPDASGAVRGMIERISTSIIAEELPVFIDLAYQIVKTVDHKNKRFDDAYFGWIKFEGTPEGIATLEEELKKDENVLRYLVVKTLRENTFISKKFPSSSAKARETEIAPEEAPLAAAPEASATAAASEDELDKAIEELVA
ncbi:MAG: 30S ribosomal protein S6 [Minisyncoccota bacterium]